jgi:hypothetical protein
MDLDRAAEANRAWSDAVRRQRDAGLIIKNHDVAAQIIAGRSGPGAEQQAFLGDVAGKRLLDLGCGGFDRHRGDVRRLIEAALARAGV